MRGVSPTQTAFSHTLLVVYLLLCCLSVHVQGADLYVDDSFAGSSDGSEGAPYTTIQAALDASVANDHIHVSPGEYTEQLDVAFNITITVTEGKDSVNMTCTDSYFMKVADTPEEDFASPISVMVEGLHIRDCLPNFADLGSVIRLGMRSSMVIEDSVFHDLLSYNVGNVASMEDNSSLILNNIHAYNLELGLNYITSTFSSVLVAAVTGTSVTVTNSIVERATIAYTGYSYSTNILSCHDCLLMFVKNVTFADSTLRFPCIHFGATLDEYASIGIIEDSVFIDLIGVADSGNGVGVEAIIYGHGAEFHVRRSNFINNRESTDVLSADNSGMVKVFNGALGTIATVSDCIFKNNFQHKGSAIVASTNSSVLIERCLFEDNFAYVSGGAISLGYTLKLHASITDGIAYPDHVKVYVNVSVNDCVFRNNSANITSGDIFVKHPRDFDLCDPPEDCGFNVRIDNCSFVGSSSYFGASLFVVEESRVRVTNSKFAHIGVLEGLVPLETNRIQLADEGTVKKGWISITDNAYVELEDCEIYCSEPGMTELGWTIPDDRLCIGPALSVGLSASLVVRSSSIHDLVGDETTFGAAIVTVHDGSINVSDSSLLRNSIPFDDIDMTSSRFGFTFSGALLYSSQNSISHFTNCQIESNSALNAGAAIVHNAAALYLTNSTFVNNSALFRGGAVVLAGKTASLYVSGCSFVNTTAGDSGGAFLVDKGTAAFHSTVFENNHATTAGGAISSISGAMSISQCSFVRNEAKNGAAIHSSREIEVSDSDFIDNEATSGGALSLSHSVYILSPSSISRSLFKGNSAVSGGAIIFKEFADVNINSSTFANNHAVTTGGALSVVGRSSNIQLTSCVFDSNEATSTNFGDFSSGGAIHALELGKLAITSSNFTRNRADAFGASLFISHSPSLFTSRVKLTDLLMANNTAGFCGGAIHFSSFTSPNLFSIPSEAQIQVSGNQAVYGPDYCTQAFDGTLSRDISDARQRTSVIPGDNLLPAGRDVFVRLRDGFGQEIKLIPDTVSAVTQFEPRSRILAVGASRFLFPLNGNARLPDYQINAYGGEFSVSISISGPQLSYTIPPSFFNVSDCPQGMSLSDIGTLPSCQQCPQDTYNLVGGEDCIVCLQNANCDGGVIRAKKGFYLFLGDLDDKSVKSTAERKVDIVPCDVDRCEQDNQCAPNYQGDMCAECADGFVVVQGGCQSCPDAVNGPWFFLYCLMFLSLALFLVFFYPRKTSIFVILVYFCQVAFFMTLDLNLNTSFIFRLSTSLMAFLSLQIDFLPSRCVLSLSFYGKYFSTLVWIPMSFAFLLLVFFFIEKLFDHKGITVPLPGFFKRHVTKKGSRYRDASYRFLQMMYLPVLHAFFSLLHCKDFGFSRKLLLDRSVECQGQQYTVALLFGALYFILFILLLPLLTIFAMAVARRNFFNKGPVMFRVLDHYTDFKPKLTVFELLYYLKRLLLCTILIFMSTETPSFAGRAFVVSYFSGMSLLLHQGFKPFRQKSDNFIGMVAHLGLTSVSFHMSSEYFDPNEDSGVIGGFFFFELLLIPFVAALAYSRWEARRRLSTIVGTNSERETYLRGGPAPSHSKPVRPPTSSTSNLVEMVHPHHHHHQHQRQEQKQEDPITPSAPPPPSQSSPSSDLHMISRPSLSALQTNEVFGLPPPSNLT